MRVAAILVEGFGGDGGSGGGCCVIGRWLFGGGHRCGLWWWTGGRGGGLVFHWGFFLKEVAESGVEVAERIVVAAGCRGIVTPEPS